MAVANELTRDRIRVAERTRTLPLADGNRRQKLAISFNGKSHTHTQSVVLGDLKRNTETGVTRQMYPLSELDYSSVGTLTRTVRYFGKQHWHSPLSVMPPLCFHFHWRAVFHYFSLLFFQFLAEQQQLISALFG